MIRPGYLNTVTREEIQRLVQEQAREDLYIDFKQDYNGDTREFRKDVIAFANTAGGVLVYGVSDENQLASGVPGIDAAKADAYLSAMVQTAAQGIEPAIRIQTQVVDMEPGRVVLLVGVERSVYGPHWQKESHKMYYRTHGNNLDMDYSETRRAFLRNHSMEQELLERHRQRVASLNPGGLSHPLMAIDLFALPPNIDRLDPSDRQHLQVASELLGMRLGRAGYAVPCFDGIRSQNSDERHSTTLRRDGSYGTTHQVAVSSERRNAITPRTLCRNIVSVLCEYADIRDRLNISGPTLALFSLVGAGGYWIFGLGDRNQLDGDVLEFPPVSLSDMPNQFQTASAHVKQPWLDRVYQAGGSLRCPPIGPDGYPSTI